MWSLNEKQKEKDLPITLIKKSLALETIIKAEAREIGEFPKGQRYAYYKTTVNMLSFEDACEQHAGSKGYQISFTDDQAVKERIRVYWVHCSQDSVYQSQAELIFFGGQKPDTLYFTKKYRGDWVTEVSSLLPPLSPQQIEAGNELLDLATELKKRWRKRD